MTKPTLTQYLKTHVNFYMILAFFLPAIIHMIAFAKMEVSPWGENSMMVIDNFHQYSPFLSEFKSILESGHSLLFSWNSGLGTNFWARYGYYLASPLNWFFLLVKQESLPEFIMVLSLIRTGLSGLFFFLYARYKWKKTDFLTVAFACMYAVSGFTLAYYWNIMWFDDIALLPLVILGLEKLIRQRKGGLYCIALGIAIFSNYYIALILCIFLVPYFIVTMIAQFPRKAHSEEEFLEILSEIQEEPFVPIENQEVPLLEEAPAVSLNSLESTTLAASSQEGTPKIQEADSQEEEPISSAVLEAEASTQEEQPVSASILEVDTILEEAQPTEDTKPLLARAKPRYFTDRFEQIPFGIQWSLHRLLLFASFSLLAAGLGAIVLLPTISALSVSQSAGATFPKNITYYTNLLDVLGGHLFKMDPSVMSGNPNLYCGIAVLILLPLYCMNRKISLRSKLAYSSLLALLFISTNINVLNFLWHGTHFPNSLPFRFTFVYIFLLVAVTYETIRKRDGISKSNVVKVFLPVIAFVVFAEKIELTNVTQDVIYPSLGFLLLYTILLVIWPKQKKFYFLFALLFLLLTGTELTLNAINGLPIAGVGQRNNYTITLDETVEAVQKVQALHSPEDFGRIEFLKDTVSNTPSLYKYMGASYFSSTAVRNFTDFMEDLGLRPSSAWYIYKGNTPIVNSMLSIRYLLSKEDTYTNSLYPQVMTIPSEDADTIRVYENPWVLPLGYVVSDQLLSWRPSSTPNTFEIQNDFIRYATGSQIENVLVEAPFELGETENANFANVDGNTITASLVDSSKRGILHVIFPNVAGKKLYVYIRSRDVDYIWYKRNNTFEGHSVKFYPYVIDTQYMGDSDEVDFTISFKEYAPGKFDIWGVTLDEEKFENAMGILNSQGLILDSFADTKVKGHFTATQKGLLYTSIPYDKGWRATLDGVPVGIAHIADGFISLAVTPGDHEVEFNYMPVNFLEGTLISAFSLGFLLILFFVKPKRKDDKPAQ